jgi:hypothetical protein
MWTVLNWHPKASSVITVTDIEFSEPGGFNIRKLRRGCNHLCAVAVNMSDRYMKQIFPGNLETNT